MALPGYKATAVDGSGVTIGSTQVEVRRRSDNALASLFDAATSGSALTNPFNAGLNGDFEFFAAADDYIVTLGSGSSPQVFPLSLINSDYTDDRYAQLSGASFTGDVSFSDNDKAIFGAGSDLQIYHDGSNSYIADVGTGNLRIRGTDITLQDADGNGYISMVDGGAGGTVYLKHLGSNVLTTTSTGIDVTGNAAVSGKIKVGTGADGPVNGDELVLSKVQTNVGMSILSEDTTGQSRLIFGTQTDATAAKVQYEASSDKLIVQSGGIVTLQSGGTVDRVTIDSSGNVDVIGALSKGSGSFKISHPLKPDTHHLVHSFIEGPQADNIYRGRVALAGGSVAVNLDEAARMSEGTFVALNGNVQCFTTNEDGWTAVRGKVEGNILTVEAQTECFDTVSWMVIGERHDQHMIDTAWTDATGRVITEPEKPAVEENDLDTE